MVSEKPSQRIQRCRRPLRSRPRRCDPSCCRLRSLSAAIRPVCWTVLCPRCPAYKRQQSTPSCPLAAAIQSVRVDTSNIGGSLRVEHPEGHVDRILRCTTWRHAPYLSCRRDLRKRCMFLLSKDDVPRNELELVQNGLVNLVGDVQHGVSHAQPTTLHNRLRTIP